MYNDLTEKDIELMQKEIDYRISTIRPQLSQTIKDAKELGDLSENAEYHEARRAKGRNEGRINFLKSMILTANIIKPNKNPNEIGIFDKVEVYFEDEDDTDTFEISTTMRYDTRKNIISKESPLGSALWGKHIGDRLNVQVNETTNYYIVIKKITKCDHDDIELPIS